MELQLNKEQLRAIRHGEGPLLIIAGAGTGKTTVITERIKYLIESGKCKSSEILALTFTEKAAREMETRVDIALPYGYSNMWIATFHGFCERILRAEALAIGLDPRYKLMTEAETVQLIRRNLFAFDLNYFRPLGNPYKFVGGMLQHFARLQDENILPDEYFKWVKKIKRSTSAEAGSARDDASADKGKWGELAEAYKTYEEIKVKDGLFDFGDLIVKTIGLFEKRPNILADYQKQFKYILVDEFQDTNFAQNQLVTLLAKRAGNITVVGDDDQSIYRFRGAAVSNIIQFRKNFSKTKVVVLNKNYRSVQEILDRAYDLIQHNNPDRLEVVERVNKKLQSTRKVPADAKAMTGRLEDYVHFIHSGRVEDEAEEVVKEILRLVKLAQDRQYDWRDFAILVRANNHAEPFVRAFQRHATPYQFLGPGRLFRQPEVVDLISYLRVLYNFDDSVSMARLLGIDYFEINPRDLAKIGNWARKYNLSLFEAAERVKEILVSEDTKKKVGKIVGIIRKHLGMVKKETAGQLVYYFLEDSGLLKNLLSPDLVDAQKRAANVSKFFDKLKSYEVAHDDASVAAVVDWIELSTELGESPAATDTDWTEVNAVNILTAHSAKGLEFPVVFLVNLVEARFPTIERREQIPIPTELIKEILPAGDFHLQEERRLFYVGMTRARDRLYLTAADYYGEGKREKKISPFIFESLGDSVKRAKQENKETQQLSFMDYSKQELEVEDRKLEKLKIDYLSYSQIETFQICPLHYKLRYILNVPTPPASAASMGTSVHETMRDFYESVKNGGKANAGLMKDLLERNWISTGYKSRRHEERVKEKALGYVRDYLKYEFDPKRLPVLLEKSFVVPITKDLKIAGKIDRIDILPSGKIEIIDYKTGERVPEKKEVERLLHQLTFYALAATILKEEPFGKKPEDVVLSLYYFEGRKKISTTRTKEDLEKAKIEILKIRDEIEKSDFACSGNYLCENCEYSLFCGSER